MIAAAHYPSAAHLSTETLRNAALDTAKPFLDCRPTTRQTVEKGRLNFLCSASDVYCPVSGEIVEVNETLIDAPETVNNDPYADGWLFTVRLEDSDELESLMDADGYRDHTEE